MPTWAVVLLSIVGGLGMASPWFVMALIFRNDPFKKLQ